MDQLFLQYILYSAAEKQWQLYFHLIKSDGKVVKSKEVNCHSSSSQHVLSIANNGKQRDFRIKHCQDSRGRMHKINYCI